MTIRTIALSTSLVFACLPCFAVDTEFQKALNSGARNLAVTMPEYPPEALKAGIVGKVLFEFGLDEKGMPKKIEIVTSEPADVFDAAVKNAVASWKYLPNMKLACDVENARARQQIWFEIQNGQPSISMSKVLDLPYIQPVIERPRGDGKLAEIVPGEDGDDRFFLVKDSGLVAKNGRLPRPTYPEDARAKGIQGLAIVKFYVMPNGKVEQPKVIYSLPPRIFDATVRNAVSEFEFEVSESAPIRKKKNACIEFTFTLSD